MKKNLVLINLVLDRSGSMASIKEEMIAAVNNLLESQERLNNIEVKVNLFIFDTKEYILNNISRTRSMSLNSLLKQNKPGKTFEIVFENTPVKDVRLNNFNFIPRGGTALYDALCEIIDYVGEQLSNLQEYLRPEKILNVIITDGQENSSQSFNANDVKNRINHQESKYNWEFLYLGANQDAITTGQSIGLTPNKCFTYIANYDGVNSLSRGMSASVSKFATGQTKTLCVDINDYK